MVKLYDRYEQQAVFGVIASQCNVIWLPPSATQLDTSAGRAVSGALEQLVVWDTKTGEIVHKLADGLTPGALNANTSRAPAAIVVVAAHAASGLVALGHADGAVKVWDLTSGAVVLAFAGHKAAVATLCFDASGTRLVSGLADASLIVWDLVAEEGLFKLKGHKAPLTGAVLVHAPASQATVAEEGEDYLVLVAKDGLVKLWDLKARQCIETHLAHLGEAWAVGASAAQDMLVTCGAGALASVWALDLAAADGARMRHRGDFAKQSGARCTGVAFTRVHDAAGSHEVFFLQNLDRTCELVRLRAADEIAKATARRTKRLADKGLDAGEIAQQLRDAELAMLLAPLATVRCGAKVRSCVWVPGRRRLELLVALANNSIEQHRVAVPDALRKAAPGSLVALRAYAVDLAGHRSDVRAMDVSDDDRLLATAANGELKVWNLRTHNVVRTFALAGGYALCCKFLPGGTLVAVGFKSGALELYDLARSAMVDRVEAAHALAAGGADDSGAAVWSMDITPDGRRLVTGGNDKAVRFWDVQVVHEAVPGSRAEVASLKLALAQTLQLSDEVLCVRVSPDGKYLAISLLNNNVQVVFVDSLKLYLTLYGHKLPVLSIDMSADSKLIITSSADKNIKVWGLDFGDCHKSLFGHLDSIMAVRFLPDSHHFFSAGKDAMLKYWDGDKFQCIQKLPAHQSEVWALCVSRDGSFVVLASHDHSIRVWSATNDQVFLEEEREKEMDELYESELLRSLDADAAPVDPDADPADAGDAAPVSNQTMETLKGGEKLMEALDIGTADLDATAAYEAQLRDFHSKRPGASMPVKPTPNAILQAYGITGQQHVLAVLLKIRAAQLEDALLVLPFSYTVRLMRFVQIWTDADNLNGNLVHLAVICKVLFFVVRVNAKELISQRDETLRNHLVQVKTQLRTELAAAAHQLGYNTLGLKFQRAQWKLMHETEFIDEAEQRAHEDKRAVKRIFATV
ncbi:Utp12-domain-containing protein [Metschnikowia bicuspidata var. bicuspidata NRRL YB-4993]|uniref:Utp12-domain-containing protein n=1 Tax=Metschnikowia bicuspidata var. bicuspidata NRRL YB-4993 TaxID=869754 RepID=A0A1A0HEY8_9ASCO|nr:Utp12-domain-containing protein [Metschnikowia bicuspidata var. bicuspidata NRRL YB-4993]OBA22540.1 Utp12-domain-containing protein [Metschnikowia bicuspidata var. bicuspidata NRRL YB-4993]